MGNKITKVISRIDSVSDNMKVQLERFRPLGITDLSPADGEPETVCIFMYLTDEDAEAKYIEFLTRVLPQVSGSIDDLMKTADDEWYIRDTLADGLVSFWVDDAVYERGKAQFKAHIENLKSLTKGKIRDILSSMAMQLYYDSVNQHRSSSSFTDDVELIPEYVKRYVLDNEPDAEKHMESWADVWSVLTSVKGKNGESAKWPEKEKYAGYSYLKKAKRLMSSVFELI